VQFIRTQQVLEMIGVGRTTLWEMVRDGRFPPPVRITERISGYQLEDVEQWMRLRADGLSWPRSGTAAPSWGRRGGARLGVARQASTTQGAPR
jgi:prophage regulatory protein